MAKWKHRLIEKDVVARTGVCAACGPVKLSVRKRGAGVRVGCGEARASDPTRRNGWHRARGGHGYSRGEVREMVEGKSCALCGSADLPRLDHDHESGRKREVLCHRCNTALGLMDDDPERLMAGARYILKHRAP